MVKKWFARIAADWGYGVQFLDLVLVSWEPFHHFTFPPFHLKNTFPPFHENSWARKETKNAYTC